MYVYVYLYALSRTVTRHRISPSETPELLKQYKILHTVRAYKIKLWVFFKIIDTVAESEFDRWAYCD